MTETCSNSTTAFVDYGVGDRIDLVHRVRYRLLDRDDDSFDPSPAFFDRLSTAFRAAFVRAASLPIVPEPVDEAVDDAAEITRYEFRDRPDADLRYAVLPAFYRTVAELYCTYRDDYPEGGVGVGYDDDGGIPARTPPPE